MSDDVVIVGAGHSKFGKRKDEGIRELAFEAVQDLLKDFNKGLDDIDASVVGIAGEEFSGQGAPAAVVVDEIGMAG